MSAADPVIDRARRLRRRVLQSLVTLPRALLDAMPPWSIALAELMGRRLLNAPAARWEVRLVDEATGQPVAPTVPAPEAPAPAAAAALDEAIVRSADVLARYAVRAAFVDRRGNVVRVEYANLGRQSHAERIEEAELLTLNASAECEPEVPIRIEAEGEMMVFNALCPTDTPGVYTSNTLVLTAGNLCWDTRAGRYCAPGVYIVVAGGGCAGVWRTAYGDFENDGVAVEHYAITACMTLSARVA